MFNKTQRGKVTYMQLMISSAVTVCPTNRHSCFPNYDQPLLLNCTIPKIQSPRFPYCDIDTSAMNRPLMIVTTESLSPKILTKNDRLLCDARLACHKLKLPSPSAMPNLLPCCENRHRVTLANVPGGRGVHTTCWWPHSHICTEPSWPPVKYNGINGWAHIRFMLSTLCFKTFEMIKANQD